MSVTTRAVPGDAGESTDVSLVAGLDIGGTKVHAVVLDPRRPCTVLGEHRVPTLGGAPGVLASALEALDAAARAASTETAGLRSLGTGVPGLVDARLGDVAHAVNLGLDGAVLGLRDSLTTATGLTVTVENDVNAAALGAAAWLGREASPTPASAATSHLPRPGSDLAYLSVGTGLASGLVLDGVLRRGASGAAGEIGHLVLDRAGAPCACGQRGCLETLASGSAIERLWPTAGEVPAALALFDAADAGDPRAIEVVRTVTAHLALAVRVLTATVDVDRVMLGGGVAMLGERLAELVRVHLRAAADGSPFLASADLPGRLVVAPLGVPLGAIGAALVGTAAIPAPTPWPEEEPATAVSVPGGAR